MFPVHHNSVLNSNNEKIYKKSGSKALTMLKNDKYS